jgi:hypothetical protein
MKLTVMDQEIAIIIVLVSQEQFKDVSLE